MSTNYNGDEPYACPFSIPYLVPGKGFSYQNSNQSTDYSYDVTGVPFVNPAAAGQVGYFPASLLTYMHAFFWNYVGGTPPQDLYNIVPFQNGGTLFWTYGY